MEDTCLCFNALKGLPGPYMYVEQDGDVYGAFYSSSIYPQTFSSHQNPKLLHFLFSFPHSPPFSFVLLPSVSSPRISSAAAALSSIPANLELYETPLQYRKWFLQDLGHEGLNNLLAAYEDKGAKAVCTFGYSQGPGHEPILFQGITDVSQACSTSTQQNVMICLIIAFKFLTFSATCHTSTGQDRSGTRANQFWLGPHLRVRGHNVSSLTLHLPSYPY